MASYLNTVYNEDIRPRTEYPKQLCCHLVSRFKIPIGATILDVGCGRGEFINGFMTCGLDSYGIDREPTGSKVDKNVVIKYADFEKGAFPFKDDYFDVVFSKSVIEHLFDPSTFISECYRVLKPGGRIIVMTPDWKSTMKVFFDDYTHRQPYTPTAVKDILGIFGFKNPFSEVFYQLPITWKYPIIKIVCKLLQLFVPVTLKSNIKFIRWSVELMVLGSGVK